MTFGTRHRGSGRSLSCATAGSAATTCLTAEEMSRFLDVLREDFPQWYAIVFTQFATATRFGEVSALRWEDVDEPRGVIYVRRSHWRTRIDTTKTGDEREVVLTDELRDEWRQTLLRMQHRHLHRGWIFPSRKGSRTTRRVAYASRSSLYSPRSRSAGPSLRTVCAALRTISSDAWHPARSRARSPAMRRRP